MLLPILYGKVRGLISCNKQGVFFAPRKFHQSLLGDTPAVSLIRGEMALTLLFIQGPQLGTFSIYKFSQNHNFQKIHQFVDGDAGMPKGRVVVFS